MRLFFNGLNSTSGIYVIVSLRNGKLYVGSAVDLKRRKKEHLKELKANKHNNARLQNHVNKYGLGDLLFKVLEFCPNEELIMREQFWVDKLDPEFNICKIVVNSVLGLRWTVNNPRKGKNHPMYGKKLPPERIKESKERLLKLWSDPDYRQKMKNAHSGQIPWNKGKSSRTT